MLLTSCKPSPTYNAFDNTFDVSVREVINNSCDTISVGCGYINLQQKEGRLRHYYQIFGFNSGVVAKGFVYFLDTIETKGDKDFKKLRSRKISNKNIISLNFELEKYGYKYNRQGKGDYSDFIEITNGKLKDTIKLNIRLDWINKNDSIIYRELEYFRVE